MQHYTLSLGPSVYNLNQNGLVWVQRLQSFYSNHAQATAEFIEIKNQLFKQVELCGIYLIGMETCTPTGPLRIRLDTAFSDRHIEVWMEISFTWYRSGQKLEQFNYLYIENEMSCTFLNILVLLNFSCHT